MLYVAYAQPAPSVLRCGSLASTTSFVFKEKKRVEKLCYMHRNPVKRGLVPEPQQWLWSSFRHYAYGERGPVVVNERRKSELRLRKVSSRRRQECPGFENHEPWGSQFRGDACGKNHPSPLRKFFHSV